MLLDQELSPTVQMSELLDKNKLQTQQLLRDQELLKICYEEIEKLLTDNEVLDQKLQSQEIQLNDRQAIIRDLSEKLENTELESLEIQQINQMKSENIKQLMEDNDALSKEVDVWYEKFQVNQEKLQLLQNEVDEARNIYQDQIEKLSKESQDKIQSLEIQLKTLEEETIQKINQLDGHLNNEQLKRMNLEEELNDNNIKLRQTEQKLEDCQQISESLTILLHDQREKTSSLEYQFNQLHQIKDLYETQLSQLTVREAEIERLNHMLKNSQQETEDWRNKYSRIELSLLEYRQFEMTNRDTASKAFALAQEVERMRDQARQRATQILDMKTVICSQEDEIQDLKRYKDVVTEENIEKDKQIEQLLNENNMLQQKSDQQQEMIQQMQNKSLELSSLLEDMMIKYNDMGNQLEFQDRALEQLRLQENTNQIDQEELQRLRGYVKKLELRLGIQNYNTESKPEGKQIQKSPKSSNQIKADPTELGKEISDQKLRDSSDMKFMKHENDEQQNHKKVEHNEDELDDKNIQRDFEDGTESEKGGDQKGLESHNRQLSDQQSVFTDADAELKRQLDQTLDENKFSKKQLQDQLCLITLMMVQIEALQTRIQMSLQREIKN